MNIVEQNWDLILNKMKLEYCSSNISYTTWIAPLTVYEVKDNTVYILVQLRASLEHIEEKYLLPFKVCIAEVTGIEFEVAFVTDNEAVIQEKKENIIKKNRVNAIYEKANLNPKYTFDTFVVGSNNNFAHAASLAVAESPGEIYNPLFIYGGVGLGKTHLMHSVAHFILANDPSKKVLYVTSETFTNELIDALKAGKTGSELAMTKFREKYRNIDVLLIDDFPFPLLIVKLDKALKRLAQPLPGDGLKDIVEGAVADGQAAGFHIAGGGDKDHRALAGRQRRVGHQRDAFAVR